MDNFFLLVIAVLFILLAGFLIFYFQTQQNFQEISEKLEEIQHPHGSMLPSETLKRDLAMHHDKLVLLEADITLARELLQWQPVVPLQEGLTKTIAYFRQRV